MKSSIQLQIRHFEKQLKVVENRETGELFSAAFESLSILVALKVSKSHEPAI
jgi:hypothetical protein